MKHSNHDNDSRNQGTTADQNKKTKGQSGQQDSTNQHGQTGRGSQEHNSMQQGDSSNRQKDKQGNKK